MKRKNPHWKPHIGVAACLIELDGTAPSEIKLIPAGTFKAKDGRPTGLPGWNLNEQNAHSIVAAAAAQSDDLLIDYEHQTLYTRQNGKPSPAAAWFKNIEWRAGLGLFATDVQWTAAAKYISPVLTYNKKTGDITGILMAALVNVPAIDGLEDLAVAHFDFSTSEDSHVDKETLALLGLDENASAEQIHSAIVALKAWETEKQQLETEMADLKASSAAAPDPAKFVPVETMTALKDQVTELSNRVSSKECEELITAALSDGRLLSAQEPWAKTLDVVALKAFLKDAQPISALSAMQTDNKTFDDDGKAILSTEQMAICSQMGIDPEQYKLTLTEAA